MTKHTTTGITVVDGVEVDITVRGDEDKASKTMMDLKDRLGWIAEAYEQETPPDELDERDEVQTPLMTVAWGQVFGEDDE